MSSRKDLDATERGDYGRMRGSSGGGAAHAPSLHQTACVRGLPLLAVLVLGCLLLVMLHPGIINSSSSRQWTHGTGTQNQATPARHIAKQDSPQGMCRYNYSVPNWAGQEVLPCDPAVCEGGDKLQPMATPLQKQRRWSPADEATYMDLYRSNRIEGWVNEPQIRYGKALTELQHSLSVFGAVGEIGVHHGKFFMPIAGYALQEESAVALDLFEDQSQNFDGSGRGSTAALLQNLKNVGIAESQVQRIAANSMHLTAGNLSAHGLPSFRMFSVDGGHSLETTLHDMNLASCLLRDGGIMVLDDVSNPAWQGVGEAMFHFAFANKRMVPLLLGYNKAYFTTASHVEQYRKFIRGNPATFPCQPIHSSRAVMAGQGFCFTHPDSGCV